MSERATILLGIPVYNERDHVLKVLGEVRRYTAEHGVEVLVVDDGSTDDTPTLVVGHPVQLVRYPRNRGYGRAMQNMLRLACCDGYQWLITMDCDEQHEPAAIPNFIAAIRRDASDVISGSRYMVPSLLDDSPPKDRQAINSTITAELNSRLGLSLTDAFCGFKAYRVSACRELSLDVDGYDFPMQFWVQAVADGLRIEELPVRLIYQDPTRSFGGPLDDPGSRLDHYRRTMQREIERCRERLGELSTISGQVSA